MKYQFSEISTVEDILKAIGRTDIPSTDVVLSQPVIDEKTGEYLANLEIDFGIHTPSPIDVEKLKSCLASQGLMSIKARIERLEKLPIQKRFIDIAQDGG